MEQDASEGWQKRLPTVKLQAEFFLMKFTDIERKRVEELAEDFKKFDSRKKGELQEDEVRFIFYFNFKLLIFYSALKSPGVAFVGEPK